MKKLILLLAVSVTTLTGYSQIDTNQVGTITGPVIDWFNHTNLAFSLGGEYDLTANRPGGYIAMAYKLSDFVLPVVRFDILTDKDWNAKVFQPQFNLQLQAPLLIANKVWVTPLQFTGVAIPLTGRGNNNLDPVFVIGAGASIHLKDKNWGIVGDFEYWTGGGYNNNQIRVGPYWKF